MRTSYQRLFTPALRPALLLGLLLSMGCASSPPQPVPKSPSTLSLEAVQACVQYEAKVAAEVAQAHSSGALSDSALAEVTEAGTALDQAWRSAALSIANGDEKSVVGARIAEMMAAKANLETVWSKYHGR